MDRNLSCVRVDGRTPCNIRNQISDKSKNIQVMTTPQRAWKLALTSGVLLFFLIPVGANSEQRSVNPHTMLGCNVREYNFTAVKEEKYLDTYCWDIITVDACWGRCDSNEKGDYKPPYKVSDHKVCTYAEINTRKVRLSQCHPDHPDPYYEVFDAVRCDCSMCNSESTSCESLNG